MDYKLCFVAGGGAETRERTSRIIRDNNLLCIEIDTIDQVIDACKTIIPEMIVLDDEHSCVEINQWVGKLRSLPRGNGPTVLLREPPSHLRDEKEHAGRSVDRLHVLHNTHFHEELRFFLQDI